MDNYVVVDADVLIDYFAGISPSAEAIERLLREDRLAVTSLVLYELACAAQTAEQLQDLELLVQAARVIGLDAAAALHAGAIWRQLKSQGQLIETADLLTAGCCLTFELPFFTRNVEHFRRVSGLRLVAVEQLLKGA